MPLVRADNVLSSPLCLSLVRTGKIAVFPFRRNIVFIEGSYRTIPQSLRDSSLYTREPLPRPPVHFGTIPSGELSIFNCPLSIVKELPALGYGQFVAAVVFFVLGVALDPVAGDAVLFT